MQGPIIVGTWTFPTQDAAITYAQQVLYRNPERTKITGDDDAFLHDLFKLNPRASEKLAGQEIVHFEVRSNRYGTKSFFFMRSDGVVDDFSFRKCFAPVKKQARAAAGTG
jgi:hypothetical protein